MVGLDGLIRHGCETRIASMYLAGWILVPFVENSSWFCISIAMHSNNYVIDTYTE